MFYKFYYKMLILLVISILIFSSTASASLPSVQISNAAFLNKIQLLKGYPDGTLRLENNITRAEFITLIIKLMGYQNFSDISSIKLNFKDLDKKHWGYNFILTAVKYKIISGYPDKTVGPDKNITYAEAMAILLKTLGYDKSMTGNWPTNIINKSRQINLTKNLEFSANNKVSRGDAAIIIYNSFFTNFAN